MSLAVVHGFPRFFPCFLPALPPFCCSTLAIFASCSFLLSLPACRFLLDLSAGAFRFPVSMPFLAFLICTPYALAVMFWAFSVWVARCHCFTAHGFLFLFRWCLRAFTTPPAVHFVSLPLAVPVFCCAGSVGSYWAFAFTSHAPLGVPIPFCPPLCAPLCLLHPPRGGTRRASPLCWN